MGSYLLASAHSILDSVQALVELKPGRPSWNEYFMAIAFLTATRSACERLHVGCVLVRDNRVVSTGYNGFLPQAPHCSRMRDDHEQATVHAEQNAIADAARRGAAVEGATAYVTHFPCIGCAKTLAAAGIAKIIYRCDYRNDPLVAEILSDSKISITQL